MVGRLIEKDDIRLGEKQSSEVNTGFLAAGEGGNLFGKIFFGESKTL